jgi:5-(carboxyamino)imidazole ribonucleotide synthase
MVGGGQLARMTQQAAIALGVELTVLTESADAPAVAAGARHHAGAADDADALRGLAGATDVLTFDHELIPRELLDDLVSRGHVLRPPPAAKALAQDKLHARTTLAARGFGVPRFTAVASADDVERFAEQERGWPVVVKAARGGYDGRGVHVVGSRADAATALAACPDGAVVEEMVPIATELAVIVARRAGGEAVAYPAVETVQEDGMLRELVVPARVEEDVDAEARRLALQLAEHALVEGLLAVELFLTRDGRLLVNELALRPHNTGHWTIEGAVTSQFEQHLRAVLDWPLGEATLTAPAVATVNVVGHGEHDPAGGLPRALAVPGAHVHLYGKAPRDGRKLGHVTALGPDPDTALATAREAAALLEAA